MGVVAIGKNTDWNTIRAEYIAGGISQRKLAAKHGVSPDVLMQKANREGWKKDRDKAISEGIAKVQQKSAAAIVNNVVIAEELKQRMLNRLLKIEEKYPFDATEVRSKINGNTVIFRIRDLTGAYKDIMENMPSEEDTSTMEKLDKMLAEVRSHAFDA